MLAISLVSCGGGSDIKSTLGMRKHAPDEFVVISNPPLKEPPSFELVAPSSAGGSIQMPTDADFERGIITDKNLSPSERDFLSKLDHKKSNQVKDLIDKEHFHHKNKQQSKGIVPKVLSKARGDSEDPVIDPVSERTRIKNNNLNNTPINEGQVQDRTRSTIDRILN